MDHGSNARFDIKTALAVVGPGILVAATGVGAGDLATATLAGANLGTAILWAVLIGAFLKFVLTEGLTRWQLATKTTVLEGASRHLAGFARWLFLGYLIVWSYLVAMALMSACGIAAHAFYPLLENAESGKVIYGSLHSLLALILVRYGGYALFEKIMSVCIGIMFFVVCATAIVLRPSWQQVAIGSVLPTIPDLDGNGLKWTIALLGGVGGTVTILCYGYWIREVKRVDVDALRTCRFDLAIGYVMTAIFGLAMVVIGSQVGELEAKGATLVIRISELLQDKLGAVGLVAKWAFMLGAWGAFFSSLLGVWQSVPYLFVDLWRMLDGNPKDESLENSAPVKSTDSRLYRLHLLLIALVPISGLLFFDFSTAMLVNGIVGALFIPLLAIALLWLNNRKDLVGEHRNSSACNIVLVLTLVFFAGALARTVWVAWSNLG